MKRLILLLPLIFTACLEETSVKDDRLNLDPVPIAVERWAVKKLTNVAASGLVTTNIAAESIDGILNVAYQEPDGHGGILIKSGQWLTTSGDSYLSVETVNTVDNSRALASSVTRSGEMQLAYQGGNVRECQENEQSDVMLARRQTQWREQTASIGYVERNPAFPDGLAGGGLSMLVDRTGTTHIAYQFFYEGCDGNSFAFPDLKMVSIAEGRSTLADEIEIDSNRYSNSGAQTYAVNAGHVSAMVMGEQKPIVFYSATNEIEDKQGLKVATWESNEWTTHWIDDDCSVEGISAKTGNNGYIAVAYYVSQCGDVTYEPKLKFAEWIDEQWHVSTVESINRIGQHPSLALTQTNQPVIASQEMATRSGYPIETLLVSTRGDHGWEFERPFESQKSGLFNQIFIEENSVIVVTKSISSSEIYWLKSPRR